MINKKRLINTFYELARIPSPTGHEEHVATVVCERLTGLGLNVIRDEFGNVLARFPGEGQPIIVCGHLDTVAAPIDRPIVVKSEGGHIISDGATILGADNKDNVAAILEAITTIIESTTPHRPIEIVFTLAEEAISRGAKELPFAELKAKTAVISDCALEYGAIILEAPGCTRFDCVIRGKPAHVKSPEQGVNALTIAVKAISMLPIGRVSPRVTSNIAFGVIGLSGLLDNPESVSVASLGLENRNTVPDHVSIYGEVRGTDGEGVRETIRHFRTSFTTAAKVAGGSALFTETVLAEGYQFTAEDEFIQEVAQVFRSQGVEPRYIDSNGGSDANVFNVNGIQTVVISSASRNNHQTDEYVVIEELYQLADFYVRLLSR